MTDTKPNQGLLQQITNAVKALLSTGSIPDNQLGALLNTIGGYQVTKSFCSIFPLWKMVIVPNFEDLIKKAREKFIKNKGGENNEN